MSGNEINYLMWYVSESTNFAALAVIVMFIQMNVDVTINYL